MEIAGNRIEQLVATAVLALLAVGCLMVLLPFLSPVLWALIVALTTWPALRKIRDALGGRQTLAAATMTLLLIAALLVPTVILATSIVDEGAEFIERIKTVFTGGAPEAPEWLRSIPLVGERLASAWADFAQGTISLKQYLPKLVKPAGAMLVKIGAGMGQGVLDIGVGLLILFFFYRDGDAAARTFRQVAAHIGGDGFRRLASVAESTMKGVVYGIVGTAFAQGILTAVGLAIAGVPAATFLGVMAGFASLVPGGTALVWGPAAIWLFSQDETGWAVFLLIWGSAVVGTADNVLKPLFISRGSDLPFVLVFLGILGGMITFGFLGIFLGPTLLAVSYALLGEWRHSDDEDAAPEGDNTDAETAV